PGTDLTFFDWPFAVPNQPGVPEIAPITLRVPEDSLEWWTARLAEHQVAAERVDGRLALTDPEGQRLELAGHAGANSFEAWPARRSRRGGVSAWPRPASNRHRSSTASTSNRSTSGSPAATFSSWPRTAPASLPTSRRRNWGATWPCRHSWSRAARRSKPA